MRGRPFIKGQKPWNYDRKVIICEFCKKEFRVPKCRIKTAKHCSIKCHNTAISRNYDHSMERNPMWKGGIQIYRRFKKKFCERCNSKKFLIVHHKDENRYNNIPENLETLCRHCHQIHHDCINNLPKKNK